LQIAISISILRVPVFRPAPAVREPQTTAFTYRASPDQVDSVRLPGSAQYCAPTRIGCKPSVAAATYCGEDGISRIQTGLFREPRTFLSRICR
jgi:hypothetical protein